MQLKKRVQRTLRTKSIRQVLRNDISDETDAYHTSGPFGLGVVIFVLCAY